MHGLDFLQDARMTTPTAAPLAYRVTPSTHARTDEARAALLAGDLGFGKLAFKIFTGADDI